MEEVNTGEGELMSEDKNTEMYNRWMRSLKDLQEDDRIDKNMMGELDCGMNEMMNKLYGAIGDECGEDGGVKI